MVTVGDLLVTCWWLLVLMVTVNYGHLFLGRRSSVRGLSAGSVYFGSPGWIWEYLFRGSGCHPFSGCSCDDSDVISSSVYFGTPQVGFMVTQLTVTGSENGSSDDLVAQWPAFMHLHRIHLHSTRVYPYSGSTFWLRFWLRDIQMSECYWWKIICLCETKIKGIFLVRIDIACVSHTNPFAVL